jgi:soluble lytic murein transglycosylase-like protein
MDRISGFTSDQRSGRYAVWGRVAVALTAVALMRPVGGEIFLRDDGASGIALSNQPAVEQVQEIAEPLRLTPESTPAAATLTVPAPPTRREQLALLVSAAAATHGLPEELLTAVIEVESNFNAAAVSPAGAVGLMQLMPGTARYLGVKNAHDPASNIDGGARYLKKLLGRFDNNLHLALAAYNAGPSTVLRSGTIPPYAETQRYVPKVIQRYHSLLGGRAKTH